MLNLANPGFSLQHISAAKKIRYGDVYVDLTCMVKMGLGTGAYSGSDAMSDKQAVLRMSPTFMPKNWEGLGCHVHGFFCALLMSGSNGSKAFSRCRGHTVPSQHMFEHFSTLPLQ